MRRLLFLVSAVCLVVAIVLATSSAARRALSPSGTDAGALATLHAPPAGAPASTEPATPAPVMTRERVAVEPVATASPSASLSTQDAAHSALGSSALRIAIDPETGKPGLPETGLRGPLTVEEMQALARAEAAGLVTLRNPDGSETLNHEGRFADHSIVRVGPDGKIVFECVHGEGQLEHALHANAPARAAGEEK